MAIKNARITDFIVKGEDFFVAHLDNGGVRVGMVAGVCYSLNKDCALYGSAVNCADESEAEACFDLCVENYGL